MASRQSESRPASDPLIFFHRVEDAFDTTEDVDVDPVLGTYRGSAVVEMPAPSHTNTLDLYTENWLLKAQNAILRQQLEGLDARISRVEEQLPDFKVVVLREISRDQAKSEILELFKGDAVLDYEDIVDRLHLDLAEVVAICQELIDEGKIGPNA